MAAPDPKLDSLSPNPPQQGGGSVPVPDPTVLTTALVDRALAAFREVMETRLEGTDKATILALDKVDEAIRDAHEQNQSLYDDLTRQLEAGSDLAKEKIERLREVHDQKFEGIDTRFQERDERSAQSAIDSRISLDAALAAAKEAVSEQNAANAKAIAKSEDATQKQIDSNKTLMDTSLKSLQDQIVVIRENQAERAGQSHGLNAGWGYLIGAIGLISAIISIAIVVGRL